MKPLHKSVLSPNDELLKIIISINILIEGLCSKETTTNCVTFVQFVLRFYIINYLKRGDKALRLFVREFGRKQAFVLDLISFLNSNEKSPNIKDTRMACSKSQGKSCVREY